MGQLDGKIALVTGAADGIGLSVAKHFVHEGASLIISDKNEEALAKTEAYFKEQNIDVLSCYADVCSVEDIKFLMNKISSDHGKLDILVNNAGGNVRGDFRHMHEDMVSEVIETNLNGTIRCSREAFTLLKTSGSACVINLSSILAAKHMRQVSIYSATKGGVEALSRAMAVEFAPYGIRVNYVAPGFIETKLTERFTKHPHISKVLLDQTPLRRFGQPDEIAKAVVFLASDNASYITGTGLTIDGGVSISVA